MVWDKTWETVFRSQEWGKYPPEELIRFIARNFYKVPDRKKIKILDVGCGTGTCTWYLTREGFSAYGIDGSKTAIKIAEERFMKEGLKGEFKVGDLTNISYPNEYFEGGVDIAAIQHNDIKSQRKIISEVYRVLKPHGKFFSMMIAKDSYGYGLGNEIEKNTFGDIEKGPFAGKGIVHFFEEREIRELLHNFRNIMIDI